MLDALIDGERDPFVLAEMARTRMRPKIAELRRARKGDAALRSALCESAWTVSRTQGYLGSLYRQMHRRFGRKGETKAAFAVGHAILVIVWHLLHDQRDYEDLGADFLDRRHEAEARKRYLVRQLESLGHKVTIEPAA